MIRATFYTLALKLFLGCSTLAGGLKTDARITRFRVGRTEKNRNNDDMP